MLLPIDIGNTAIKAGIVRDGQLERNAVFPSETSAISAIEKLAADEGAGTAIICAVKPRLATELNARLAAAGLTVITADYRTIPLKNRYEPPSAVGSDRLMAAYAVNRLFRRDAIVIDMGTAITFEAVTRDGAYLGGQIFPGVELLAESLAAHTAQLPRVHIDRTAYPACAVTTIDAVAGGIFHGVTAVLTGVVCCIRAECGDDWPVYITGGYARILAPVLPADWTLLPDLIMDGLILLHRELTHG